MHGSWDLMVLGESMGTQSHKRGGGGGGGGGDGSLVLLCTNSNYVKNWNLVLFIYAIFL